MSANLPALRRSRRLDSGALTLAAVNGRALVTNPGLRTTPRDEPDPDRESIELAHAAPIQLGALKVEPASRRIVDHDGREQILEPRVMQVLVALAKADGQIVSRDDLLASCWGGVVVSEDALNRVMSRLRRLADDFGAFRIETVTKVGYRLKATAERPVAGAASPSICVLPFVNMSDDQQQEYFSDGITEDIITDLSKVASLFVVSRTSAFAFKDRRLDISEVASRLKVDHVLEGSVRKAGGRVRITAQLIDGATGGHLWAERYDRDLDDIFALQDEISEAVVAALKLKLAPAEKQAIERRGTSNLQAYDYYLLARRFYVPGREGDRDAMQAIVRLTKRATELDPAYAEAWTLLALAQTALRGWLNTGEDGNAAVERALGLNPGLAEAHAVKARHLALDRRFDEAHVEIDAAFAIEPDSWVTHSEAGRLYYSEQRYRDAARHLELAIHAGMAAGDAGLLMSSYRAVGDWEGVMRAARLTVDRADHALQKDYVNGAAIGCSVGALAALGEVDRAREMIERALLIDPDNDAMRYNLACGAVAFLNDVDKAFTLLEPVFVNMPRVCLQQAVVDPDFASIRDDPRFTALIAAAEARLAAAAEPGAERG